MAKHNEATPSFDNLLNFRDVGENINRILGSQSMQTGLLYRSARPDGTSPADRDKLLNKYHIKTVIDLRSKTELINAAKKHSDAVALAQSAVVPSSTDAVAGPLKIAGIRYAEINLNGKGFERALIWQLKYSSFAKLIALMALGYRTEGIAVLGKEVMKPKGLIGLGIDTLDHSGPEIKQVFDVLADESAYPVLIHCTQGKDRTGLTILLALMICGIDLKAISDDYVRSETELEPEKRERMEEITSIGLDESFATCPVDFSEKMKQHIDRRFGGVESYMRSIGIDHDKQQIIRYILMKGNAS